MNQHLTMPLRVFLAQTGADLRSLSDRYAELAWKEGWKPGKTRAKADPNDPYQGGPMEVAATTPCKFLQTKDGSAIQIAPGKAYQLNDLSDASVTFLGQHQVECYQAQSGDAVLADDVMNIPSSLFLEGANGKAIELTPMRRIRMRELSDASLDHLGVLHLKSSATAGKDICHQEDVATYAENIANDHKHHLNNALAIAATLEAFVDWMGADAEFTVQDAINMISDLLDGNDPDLARGLTCCARMSWIGRAMQDGSYTDSADFTFYHNLGKNAADLDEYVVVPAFRRLAQDLRNGNFS